jgi:hypothetical protein
MSLPFSEELYKLFHARWTSPKYEEVVNQGHTSSNSLTR